MLNHVHLPCAKFYSLLLLRLIPLPTLPVTCVALLQMTLDILTRGTFIMPRWTSRQLLAWIIAFSYVLLWFNSICDAQLQLTCDVYPSLIPGTRYYYIFGDPSYGWSAEHSFTAAPESGPNASTRVIAFGGRVYGPCLIGQWYLYCACNC